MKLTAFLLPGLVFIAFCIARSPSLSRSICNVSTSLLFVISLYIIQSSAKSLIVHSKFLQIWFTYAGNSSGPSLPSSSTADVNLISSANYPPTLSANDLKGIPLPMCMVIRTYSSIAFITLRYSGMPHCAFQCSQERHTPQTLSLNAPLPWEADLEIISVCWSALSGTLLLHRPYGACSLTEAQQANWLFL